MTPYQIQVTDLVDPISNVLPVMWLGSKGLFTAILVAIISVEIYRRAMQSKFKITLPESVTPAVLKSFLAIIPAGVTLLFFWILRVIIDFSPFDNIHTVLGEFVSTPLTHITRTI
ncbi:MAG: PTS transporter subunit EIIC [Brevinema sp.]